jgi:alpha-beta hydrolase superfamily lysophospholipase
MDVPERRPKEPNPQSDEPDRQGGATGPRWLRGLAVTRGFAWGTMKRAARALGYGLTGALLVGIVIMIVELESRPDLKVWHEADLDEEFTVDSEVTSFADYLALEDRLFAELGEEVYGQIELEDRRQINRYYRGSLSDPGRWETNWNRSFELPVQSPRAGVLLLHGLSDSPYSMRSLGLRLHEEGAWVVGLRIPGHGTAPSGLLRIDWEDMDAAVRLAAAHLRDKAGTHPLYLVGYSNGGALAVLYALTALEDPSLPAPSGIVLISPEIGVSKLAALAVWQERLGHLLGLEKLAWNSILPEYDPYKYQSFALNAGKLAHELTREIQSRITRLERAGELGGMHPVLAFQSLVDATVSAPALVTGLLERLPTTDDELVVFDINRHVELGPVLKANPGRDMDSVLRSARGAFILTLVTSESDEGLAVLARQYLPGEEDATESALEMVWPPDVYSLSHVALPFPPDDPLYGSDPTVTPLIHLGRLALYGERGLLEVSDSELLRQRWNPFHEYMVARTVGFMGMKTADGEAADR